MSGIEVTGPKIMFEIPILGGITITETVVWSWCIIGVVFLLCLVLTHKLEKVPVKKTQQIAEKLVITMDSLVDAADFVRMVEKRQSIKISAPEEIAYKNGWIDKDTLLASAQRYGKSPYGEHLKRVAEGKIRY